MLLLSRARARLLQTLDNARRRVPAYRTLNRIDLDRAALLHNFRLFQVRYPRLSIIPILKGNAYGHGLRETARMLDGASCDLLAVDGYFEAGVIRHSTKHRILVLGYILPENVPLVDTRRCSFVVQDIAGLEAFGRLGRPVRIHMEINTGMNRLGLQPDEIDAYLAALRRFPLLRLEGVMTHLADADHPDGDAHLRPQAALFDACVERILAEGFTPRFIHIAQTAGSGKIQCRYATALRLGIGLYGINPLDPRDPHHADLSGLRPVLSLKSTIVKVLPLRPGDRVSYGGTFTAPRAMRLGVLPLGYYEGVPRELSSAGAVTAGGHALPIVGRVCMNHTMIDLGRSGLSAGDEVTVISADPAQPNSLASLSAAHHLFTYTVLTNLSGTVRRRAV